MALMAEFQSLHQQYKNNPYPSLSERKKLLIAIKKILQTEAYTLAEAINKDFTHRPVEETLFLEIFPTIKA
ncbi:TPA: coniferyl aldehyde dehydrogenase, partial [Legionella pneumophila]